MSTNIVTVRELGGGHKLIELNGREIPFVLNYVAVKEPGMDLYEVGLTFHAYQVNEVGDGVDLPEHTANPRADRYAIRLNRIELTLGKAFHKLQHARWWQYPRVIREVKDILIDLFNLGEVK